MSHIKLFMNTALVIGALGTLATSAPAEAKRFRVKNCTTIEWVQVASYNGSDSSMFSPHSKKQVKSGETAQLKCDSNRCRFDVQDTRFSYRKGKIGKRKWLKLDITRHGNMQNYYYVSVSKNEPQC
ncbi:MULTISPECIES: hypothetical protein [Pseudoalteromonas]|uniref:Uncharacterized protein n=2 Tax=Pseudoalteromonas rubra TaxID=43658 RepID=A0A0U3IAR5_9GAMM|nr:MULTISPECIES: hypothetical protein [Pseudoalteromonas]ALU44832.1 hypothetical protein AT705_18890 [Pseudoalteromonas rubra]MDK1313215.1 hypothetical protein [Pseudoalteromonas sp. R96]